MPFMPKYISHLHMYNTHESHDFRYCWGRLELEKAISMLSPSSGVTTSSSISKAYPATSGSIPDSKTRSSSEKFNLDKQSRYFWEPPWMTDNFFCISIILSYFVTRWYNNLIASVIICALAWLAIRNWDWKFMAYTSLHDYLWNHTTHLTHRLWDRPIFQWYVHS